MRRTGKEGIHERVDQGARAKAEHSRAVRKAHLIKELEGTTHWEGCESCHPWCAELLDISRQDRCLGAMCDRTDCEPEFTEQLLTAYSQTVLHPGRYVDVIITDDDGEID